MKITLTDPTTVRITWPAYDDATEAEVVRRLNTVPGIQGMGHRWSAPAFQVARLTDLFPKASFDYDAMAACDATARTFCASMAQMGVQLRIDASGAVCGHGDGVSPLLQGLIDERSHALRPWVTRGYGQPKPRRQAAEPVHGPLTADEAKFEPWVRGVQNAARQAEMEAFEYPRRRTKKAKAR